MGRLSVRGRGEGARDAEANRAGVCMSTYYSSSLIARSLIFFNAVLLSPFDGFLCFPLFFIHNAEACVLLIIFIES